MDAVIKWIEPFLAEIGTAIICILVSMFCGIGLLVLFKGIIKLAIRPRSHFLRLVFQIIPASLEFVFFTGIGSFLCLCVGAAIKRLLNLPFALPFGAVLGFILGGLYALVLIALKWGHCYIDEHDYAPVLDLDGGNYPYDACTRCRKHFPD